MYSGIRQGCPVSAILYLFAVEILYTKINNSVCVKGFTINSTKIRKKLN